MLQKKKIYKQLPTRNLSDFWHDTRRKFTSRKSFLSIKETSSRNEIISISLLWVRDRAELNVVPR